LVPRDAPPLPGNLSIFDARLDRVAEPVAEGPGELARDQDVPDRVPTLCGAARDLPEVEVLPDPDARADPQPVADAEGRGDLGHEIQSEARLPLAALPGPIALGEEVGRGVPRADRIGRRGARIDQRGAEQLVDPVDPL